MADPCQPLMKSFTTKATAAKVQKTTDKVNELAEKAGKLEISSPSTLNASAKAFEMPPASGNAEKKDIDKPAKKPAKKTESVKSKPEKKPQQTESVKSESAKDTSPKSESQKTVSQNSESQKKPKSKETKSNEPTEQETKSKESKSKETTEKTESITTPKQRKPRTPVQRPKPKVETDLLSTEINQLRIRFTPTGFTQTKNDESVVLHCVLPITDPDFPFDLPTVRLEITLPNAYPGTAEASIRPVFKVLNSDLPASLVSQIDKNMRWGVSSLPGGVLVCRPMLKYLEDHLEKWLIDGQDKGIKFVASSAIEVTKSDEPVAVFKEETEKEGGKEVIQNKSKTKENEISVSETVSRISKGDWLIPTPVCDQTDVGGIAYSLIGHFSICKGIDLICSQKLSILVTCDRCKFAFPVQDLRPFVDRMEHCPKCTNLTKFYYKMQLITPGCDIEGPEDGTLEGFIGSLRMLRAKPMDLLPSRLQTACSRCYGRENEFGDAGSTDQLASFCKIESVRIGESLGFNCFSCHQRIRLLLDRIEWRTEEVGSASKPALKPKSSSSSSAQPTLSVGQPLPQNGACLHYKKSFRWYRFPCCGMAFPCDECHNADPVAKGHPVEWATRFICGFCSREQSISVKECPECGKDTSAAGRRKTAFWEGGKGTRNQIFMSRKDSKKYKDYSRNSTSAVKKNKDKG